MLKNKEASFRPSWESEKTWIVRLKEKQYKLVVCYSGARVEVLTFSKTFCVLLGTWIHHLVSPHLQKKKI